MTVQDKVDICMNSQESSASPYNGHITLTVLKKNLLLSKVYRRNFFLVLANGKSDVFHDSEEDI